MKFRFQLIFEPAFLPLQLMCLLYGAVIHIDGPLTPLVLTIWHFVLPWLTGVVEVKYRALNLTHKQWLRDYLIASAFFGVLMLVLPYIFGNERPLGYMLVFVVGVAVGMWLNSKNLAGSRRIWGGVSATNRPTSPAWLGSVLAPMVAPWLVFAFIALVILVVAIRQDTALEDLAGFLGMGVALLWIAPLWSFTNLQSWVALGRPREQWIKLAWLSDAVALALLLGLTTLYWLTFQPPISALGLALMVLASLLPTLSLMNVVVFQAKAWVVCAGIGVASGATGMVGIWLAVIWENSALFYVVAVTLIGVGFILEGPVRRRVTQNHVPRRAIL
ncbi:hypothetical protein [Corynebacterium epidermidicanis]|uniref:Uncharacterized protein n=1 Tax=Corynebacterium epidermidicanis TaxID=1050174 RepID=A0A0G3GZI5_9CORY|nr:hypothetical protein [Corynebacterium epidermidicanis]AKK04217.1 hypothetical protein CEPID_11970 [Corynebacterium epidermidicanis]